MKNKYKICHLTSVHPLYDTRIFYEQCKKSVNAGYDVALVVQNNKEEEIDGIKVKGIDKPQNRIQTIACWQFLINRGKGCQC